MRSFVLRRGHFSPAQKRSLEALLPRYGIAYRPRVLDLSDCFGRQAPVVLEIGSGMGETTAQIAAALPDRNFLAVEVYAPGVGALLRRIEEQGLTNLRVIQHDAVEVLRDMIPEKSLAGVHLYFPDPWPKARHHKRRLIQPPFVARLTRHLAEEGYLHCATDWQPYAEQMLEVLEAEPALVNSAASGGYSERPAWRPETKFERRGLALGHGVFDLLFYRSRRA